MTSLKGPGEAETYDGSTLRIAIVHARWNTPIISSLVTGARKALLAAGVKPQNIITQSVPGSYELPLAVQRIYSASQLEAANNNTAPAFRSATDLLSSTSLSDLTAPIADAAAADTTTLTLSPPLATSQAPVQQEDEELKSAFDAVIAVGVLIKGETMHFEYIADAVSHGLMRVQLDTGVPVVFGLLTVLSEEQGKARAGMVEGMGHDHGEDWGSAAVELGVKRKGWGEGRVV
ncbi:MAG: hypothetical protein Q9195_001814 [Heterodermia aff. obscurata]